MIDVKDALESVIDHTPVLQTETVPLIETLHSVLAETIVARDDSLCSTHRKWMDME